ncbi:RNA polymerase sigma factor [Paenibacillus taiwanensis]|uniref:RNA polymerase sigma factor n=1 Tax=Paenibacillus taiwanensis TaxID=401638 RepID=UPI001FE15B88|nr:sigma-70 family RNA polymerase sigma factor [Paenibacillus taiwanensis]
MLSRWDKKDEGMFVAELYIRYYPMMRKKAFEITRDHSVVEDIIQDAFIRLMNKIPLLRSLDSGKRVSYILQTIRHTALNYMKQHAKNKKYTTTCYSDLEWICDAQLSIEDTYNAKEGLHSVSGIISELPKRDRLLLYNKYILDLDDHAISRSMKIPTANIRSYLTRARQRALKILLKHKSYITRAHPQI